MTDKRIIKEVFVDEGNMFELLVECSPKPVEKPEAFTWLALKQVETYFKLSLSEYASELLIRKLSLNMLTKPWEVQRPSVPIARELAAQSALQTTLNTRLEILRDLTQRQAVYQVLR
jgi:hypothetical protein